MKKLAIITTHPIQYNAPFFRLIASSDHIDLTVFYSDYSFDSDPFDREFNQEVQWDIPLLEGYKYEIAGSVNTSDPHVLTLQSDFKLLTRLEEFGPDALLVYGWNPKEHLKCMRYFSGKIPILFRGDSTLLDELGFFRNIARNLVLKYVFTHIDFALYCGQANKKYFIEAGLKEDQLIYVPHAVDKDRFHAESTSLRSSWGVDPDAIVVLFAGKFISKKDPVFLLNSFIEAIDELDQKVKLVFVGNGMLAESLKNLSKTYDQVLVQGFVNQRDMPKVYCSADIYCLPSKGPGETWGLAVNEAMLSSCALLLSDKVGSYQDLLINGKNGFLFSKSKSGDLKEKLIDITSDLERLKKMQEESSRLIQPFNYEQGLKELEKLLLTL